MDRVLNLNFSLEEDDLEAGAARVLRCVRPSWQPDNLIFKVFTDGITNKLIGCSEKDNPNDVVLVRVYGQNTDLLIDRKAETENFKLLHESGYAPRLYATFKNGLAYEFVPGETLNVETVKSPSIFPLVASMMAKIHSIPKDKDVKPCVWDKIEHYISLIPNHYCSAEKQLIFEKYFVHGVYNIRKEFDLLKTKLFYENSPVVFCHNDLLLANIIHFNGQVTFIDYEYAACNYQAYDIANHFAEFAGVSEVDYSLYPDKNFQRQWLKIYLEEYFCLTKNMKEVGDEDIDSLYNQINRFVLLAHLYWGAWALVQANFSTIEFDFIGYGVQRLEEYTAKKGLFLM